MGMLLGGIWIGLRRVLVWVFSTYIAQWAAKALIGIGIALVVHNLAMPQLMAYIKSHTSGMSQFLFDAFGAVGGDVVISMIISAYVAATTGNVVVKALKK